MARRAKVLDIDHGWKDFRRRILQLGDQILEVGIFDDPELALAAAVNEFGTQNAGKNRNVRIPSRPAWRTAIDQGTPLYDRALVKAYDLIASGAMTPKAALELIGDRVKADIIRVIRAWTAPPNEPSTIKARSKRRNDPLVATGRTIKAIKRRVRRR